MSKGGRKRRVSSKFIIKAPIGFVFKIPGEYGDTGIIVGKNHILWFGYDGDGANVYKFYDNANIVKGRPYEVICD